MNRYKVSSVVILVWGLLWPGVGFGQTLEESSAKARRMLDQAIQALGGPAYLGLRDSSCEGRVANYARGDLTGFDRFWDFVKLPDKNRTEYSKKRNIIYVNNGQAGWELDQAGVHESTPETIARFQENLRRDLGTILRQRRTEEGISFRYLGTEFVDLHPGDVAELNDKDGQIIRIVLNQTTHLPLKTIYYVRDRVIRERVEEAERYGNYQLVQGIQTPFYVARERNGRKVFEVFYERCQFSTGLPDSFFSREALEQVWAKQDKKKKK